MTFDSQLLSSTIPFREYVPQSYSVIKDGVFPSGVSENIYSGWIEKFNQNQTVQAKEFTYSSDGYNIKAYYLYPNEVPNKGLPLVLFNRGGRGKYGMINVLTINNLLAPLVLKGYIILASQYRGTDGGEGADEFGGAEVQDIVELYNLRHQLKHWDGKNIYMFGWSRGGMSTLLALKNGVEVNAIALGAPLIDLTLSTDDNAKREEWLMRVLPDYKEQGFKALEDRSAPYWINKLNYTPTLLMHGDADNDVNIAHSRQFNQLLIRKQTPTKLIEYEGGNHYLNRQRDDVMENIHQWFNTYQSRQ